MVRAPGGQLITRIKTEAAAGKLSADVINHSDRGLMLALQDLLADYAPPNAADYREDVQVSPKIWPRQTLGWSIAYNTELVKNPPKIVDGPDQARVRQQADRPGRSRPSGGTTWTRIMFERQVLGEDYWKKQAAVGTALYPSGAPLVGCAGARRGLDRAAALQRHLHEAEGRRAGRDLLPARGRAAATCTAPASPRPPPIPTPPGCS